VQPAETRALPVPLTGNQTKPNAHLRQWLGIWLFALGLRAACVAALDVSPAWDGVIYERAAEQLAHGQGYTQRILDEGAPAKPTAFFPPGYAAVLSVLHRVAHGPALDPWLQVFVSSCFVPAAWLLGRRLGGVRAGRYAAWLMAVWPGGILLSASRFTEPLFSILLAAACLWVLYARGHKRFRALLGAAVLLGFAAYLRPTALAVVPFLGAAAGFLVAAPSALGRARRGLAWASLATALACAPLVPWMVRNQLALGSPVLVSTNGGYNLLLGTLGEGNYGSLDPAMDCPVGMKEVAVDRCRSERALQRIRRDPLAWLARGVLKVVHTVGHDSAPAQFLTAVSAPPPERVVLIALALCRGFWLPFFGLACVGALFVSRERSLHARGLLLAAPILGVLLLHFVYIGGDRYHAPLVPIFAALAGLALVRVFPPQLQVKARV
jgi:hypothetical protein